MVSAQLCIFICLWTPGIMVCHCLFTGVLNYFINLLKYAFRIIFSYFILPQLYNMKLIHNAYFTKHRWSLNFGCITFSSRVMSLYKWKKSWNLLFLFPNICLPQPNIMKLIHKAYYVKTQMKFEFWWCHFYSFRLKIFNSL